MKFQVQKFLFGFFTILTLQETVSSPYQDDQSEILTICLVKNNPHFNWMVRACPIFQYTDEHQEIECIFVNERTTCLAYFLNNQADFMFAEPQDLLILAMNKLDNNFVVTAELKEIGMEDEKGQFSMVVPARKSIKNLSQTKKKRFCSPGFDHNFLPLSFIKYFENKLLPRQCDPDKTVVENRIFGLSDYFDGICFNQQLSWITSAHDEQLQKYYKNLNLCCGERNNDEPCPTDKIYTLRSGAAECFLHGEGELAWTTSERVRFIFKHLQYKQHEFHYICPNGTASDKPCTWLDFPWQTIISKADFAKKAWEITEKVYSSLNDNIKFSYRRPYRLAKFKTPTNYLQDSFPEYLSTQDHPYCSQNRTVKWCVVTKLEMEKCRWISYVARVHEIEPLIECVQEYSEEICIQSVRNRSSDIFAIKPQLLSEAKKGGLTPLLHMVSQQKIGQNEIGAIVPKSLKRFHTRKSNHNLKACFEGYETYGWYYFIFLMHKITGDINWFCEDAKMVASYFIESCVKGLSKKNVTFPMNLYSLCSKISKGKENLTCTEAPKKTGTIKTDITKLTASDLECKTADDEMLRCLTKHDAAVTFVNISSLLRDSSDGWKLHYKILCFNTSSMSFTDESHTCLGSWNKHGSLMVAEDLNKIRKDEIYQLMVELDNTFGKGDRSSHLFSLYGPFYEEEGVIFSEKTLTLELECTLRCSWDVDEIMEYIGNNIVDCDINYTYALNILKIVGTCAAILICIVFYIYVWPICKSVFSEILRRYWH